MRPIKFRAWAKPDAGVGVGMSEPFSFSDISYTTDDDGIHFGETIASFDIERDFELMQFTGLVDKNGKEIYEGDVVRAEGYHPRTYLIEFIEGGFCGTRPAVMPIDINQWYGSKGCEVEVVGNAYKNPELLK